VALSSPEVKYVPISTAAQDASWLTGYWGITEVFQYWRAKILSTSGLGILRSGTTTLRMQLIRGSFNCNGGKGKIIC
jgi:hypothetical protein